MNLILNNVCSLSLIIHKLIKIIIYHVLNEINFLNFIIFQIKYDISNEI
jgi:hypothetical protein